ncbi:MAG: nicotinate-nucleotide--dimethylbenzimidazole phosphoribosyltransferase [Pseudomonadota bacterium]
MFSTLSEFEAALRAAPGPSSDAVAAAEARNGQLTKPPGALGRLEAAAIWYAGWRGTDRPSIDAPQVIVFAGNHGVAAQGVSAFPPEVTAQMVANFEAGGAAVNQLAKAAGARLDVHALALDRPSGDFTAGLALTEDALLEALNAGWQAMDPNADLLVVGEMGIGNTTPAAAIAAALFGGGAAAWTGRGTGVDDAGLARKTAVVEAGLERHAGVRGLAALGAFAGREMAAMAGAAAHARVRGIPMILDGFIASASCAALLDVSPTALDHCIAGHQSAEGAHAALLSAMGKAPALLALDMRLGEGSGGTLAINVLRGAVACLSGMATFAEAGVADG